MRKVVVFLSALVLIWLGGAALATSSESSVTFLDVGQGDASLINAGDGFQILIDGGPDERVLSELAEAMPFGDRTIEMVILSHPHLDHYNGLRFVSSHYRIAAFYTSNINSKDAEYRDLERVLAAHQVPTSQVVARRNLALPKGSIEFVYPTSPFPDALMGEPNDASLTVKVTLSNTRILFPGDAEKAEEAALVATGLIRAEILKVPHHGSKTSSTPEFIRAVQASGFVISVGARNRYHHPAPSTLDTLKSTLGRVYRTDQNGTVKVSISEGGYVVKTEK